MKDAGSVAAVVLAAGSSSRLGTNKLLAELGGEPLVRRAARLALEAGLSPMIAVVGFEAAAVRAALDGLPVQPVTNAEHGAGMASSFRVGIAAVPEECAAAIVLLPDMPLVTVDLLRRLVERFRATGAPLVATLYGDTPAPPTLYARGLFPAALAAREGGRQVVREHRAVAEVVRVPEELLVDVDRPADLERLRHIERSSDRG